MMTRTPPAEIWVIGDVQGCIHSLDQLLAQPALQHPHAHFVFVGDLVNRGPGSVEVLRRVHGLYQVKRAQTVLGNHDIHLLGRYAGIRDAGQSDTLEAVLQAHDVAELMHWLRHQPLALHLAGHLIVHAGLHPSWRLATVLSLANEVENTLRADDWQAQLAPLFGNEPTLWSADLCGTARQRYTINALTRLRHFNPEGHIDHRYKGAPNAATGLTPWFAMPHRRIELPVVFGHWSTLGLHLSADSLGIDTGCLWGGQLTALRLSDRKVVQVPNSDGPLQPL